MTLTLGRLGVVSALGALAALGASAASDALYPFSDEEIQRIVSHGPWPPSPAKDPSNRVSGNSAAIAWGEELFRDPRLSRDGMVSCANCHQAKRDFTDGLPRGKGITTVDRNTPTVANVRLNRWYGWDGAGDSLWAQSLRPMLDPREMGSDVARIAATVRGTPALASGYRRAFGGKHHTTVLHSINKIESLRRTDKDLNRTITRLLDALV